jgi:hypothetical protein
MMKLREHRHSLKRRKFNDLLEGFFVRYPEAIGFLAGWTAYPIGLALLALLKS